VLLVTILVSPVYPCGEEKPTSAGAIVFDAAEVNKVFHLHP
jgi:hypothetical protein